MIMKKLRKSFWSDTQRQPVSYRKKLLRRLRMARMRMAMKLSLVCDFALVYCDRSFLLIFALSFTFGKMNFADNKWFDLCL
jgi:hypothetical protein